jgi:hypothetical protein
MQSIRHGIEVAVDIGGGAHIAILEPFYLFFDSLYIQDVPVAAIEIFKIICYNKLKDIYYYHEGGL